MIPAILLRRLILLQSNICLSCQCDPIIMSNISAFVLLYNSWINKVCRVKFCWYLVSCDVQTSIFSVALLFSERVRTWIINRWKAASYSFYAKRTVMKKQKKCHYFNSSTEVSDTPRSRIYVSMAVECGKVLNHKLCRLYWRVWCKSRWKGKKVGKVAWKWSSHVSLNKFWGSDYGCPLEGASCTVVSST